MISEKLPIKIALLAVPEVSAAVLLSLREVFLAVGTTWNDLTGQATSARKMEPMIVSRTGQATNTVLGAAVRADLALNSAYNPDIVIVSDLTLPPMADWEPEEAWLKHHSDRGAIICSVCTGALMLAHAGLLSNRDATTHWSAISLLAEKHPDIRLHPDRVLMPTGDSHNIITSGGSASWSDLALYVVARFSGMDEARRIAKIFLLGDRGEGQLPFANLVLPKQHEDATIADVQAWVGVHYDQPNPVARMGERSGLNDRTFKRRFKKATGYSPLEYVQVLRIEEAKQELETTDQTSDEIGRAVGYEDSGAFRRLFKRLTGVTPGTYRNMFQNVGSHSTGGDASTRKATSRQ